MAGAPRSLISIGQFSLLTRLTTRALRLYDKLGILVPAYVDPDNGYRYYTADQSRTGAWIGALRAVDLPLDEVRYVLEAPAQTTRTLEIHASRLRRRRDESEQALELLRTIQEGVEPLNIPIEIREVPPARGISIELETSLATIGEDLGVAFPRLGSILRANGGRGGTDFAAYPDEEYDPQHMTVVPGISYDGGLPAQPDGIAIREFGGGRSIVATLHGRYDGLPQAWQEAWAWLAEHGHERRGPAYELYRVGHAESANPEEFVTEIVIPIHSDRTTNV
jgi:DNA-binding transcriptional MerR regulator